MVTTDRLIIFPSRANQVLMKQRLLSAKRGVALLKRKRDAIDMKLRDLSRTTGIKEGSADDKIREAIFAVTKAKMQGADLRSVVLSKVSTPTSLLRKRTMKIVGVTLYYFELEPDEDNIYAMAGISCGGQQIKTARLLFLDVLTDLVEYASLLYMTKLLKRASRQTNMRVNALDHVVIPRYLNTHNYICGELEEFEREDFYRLKRSQAKQLKAKLAFTEMLKAKELGLDLSVDLIGAFPVAEAIFEDNQFNEETVRERRRRHHQRRLEQSQSQIQSIDESFVSTSASSLAQSKENLKNIHKANQTDFPSDEDEKDP